MEAEMTLEAPQAIKAYLADHRQEMIDFIAQLVRAESPSTEPEAQALVMTILWEELNALDFQTHLESGRQTGGHLLAQRNGSPDDRPRQLLLGHCDTVWPMGTLREMPVAVNGNVMTGPGAFDMKGGLAQMIFALRALKALGLETAVSPIILINSDEEIGSPESEPHIRRWAGQANRVFVLEPSYGLSGKLKTARKGVGTFTIYIKGKAAHAGLDPGKGVSAVLELAHVIQKLFTLNEPARGVSVNVGTIEGGRRPNVIAPESKAVVDVRAPTAEAAQRVDEAIRAIRPSLPGTTIDILGGFRRPPLERTPRNRSLWQTARDIGDKLGLDLDEAAVGGASDGNLTSEFAATLDGLGAVGDGAHARHEFIYLDKMLERTTLLALLLLSAPVSE